MDHLEMDCEVALHLLKTGVILDRQHYGMVYLKTNERIDRYFSKFALSGKDVLTVEASGDQLLQAVLEGAKSVTTFDRNRFTYYTSALKQAAVLTLNYDDFRLYFDEDKIHGDGFSKELYQQVREALQDDAKLFWDYLYCNGNFEDPKQNQKVFLTGANVLLKQPDSFWNSAYFAELKCRLSQVDYRFYESDLLTLPDVLPSGQKYDAMFFSNIYDWLFPLPVSKYYKFIDQQMSSYLSEDGKCAVYYTLLADDHRMRKKFPDSYSVPNEMLHCKGRVYVYTKRPVSVVYKK